MSFIDILIADDHEFFRRNLRLLLESQPGWRVCGEAADGLEAISKAKELHPDIVLMDMSMPRMDGAEATRNICRQIPDCQVIILSQNDPALMRKIAAETGAKAFVSKSDIVRDLVPAILGIVGQENSQGASSNKPPQPDQGSDWLHGGGSLALLIWEYDWSKTPLGPLQSWPQSLRTAINLMLNSQHPIWIGWGPEMTFLYNDAYISVLSLAKHPWALGRPASEVWAEIWDVCGPLANKVFDKGEPSFADDVRLFMNRGDYLEETYYSFSYSPVYDEAGKVAGLFCPSTEITSKVLNARRLRTLSDLSAKSSSEKSIEAAASSCVEIISGNPDDIPFALLYLIDPDQENATLQGASQVKDGINRISPATISLEHSSQDVLWPIRELLESPAPRTISLGGIESLPLGPSHQRVREAMVLPVTAVGMERPAGVLIAGVNPTRKLDVEYRTFFSLVADQVATAVQNARALQQEKERADALAEIDRTKTLFFSNVSHEFRTPLTLMLGPLEDMLADSSALAPEYRERLDIAHRNSLRLLKLVNTLLDFSRIEAGRIQACYEPTDLCRLTLDLAGVFRSAIERAGIRFIVECANFEQPVYVDTEMWEKIVFNLLSNAFKFTFAGEIDISLQKLDDFVELTVRDSGTGIPASDLPHLFERFYRVKGAQGRTFEGSGIGLALVQELAKLHGGSVRVDSELNRGSVFTVTIPLGKDHLPADRIGAPRSVASTALSAEPYLEEAMRWLPDLENAPNAALPLPAPSSLETAGIGSGEQRSRILLADDNADMREYLRRLLAARYDVEAVEDGQAALQWAREHSPDLILSDVMMPRLDGFGLLHAIRGDESLRNIPVLLLSARAGEESRIEGVQSGADDYLVKPFSARELLARVETHLKLARVRRQSEEALQESHAQLAFALESSRTAMFDLDVITRQGPWNPQMAAIYDFHPQHEYITAEEWRGLFHPGDVERLATEANNIWKQKEKETFEFEFRTVRRSGEIRWVLSHGRIVRDSSGNPVRMIGTHTDITERRAVEQAFRQSEERYRAIVETTPECVKLVAPDGILLHMNSSGLHMVGATSAEAVMGKSVYDLIAAEDRERFRAFNEKICSGQKGSLEFDIIGLDGQRRHMETHAAPLRNLDGSTVQLAVTRDVTRRKVAEEAKGLLAAIVTSSDDAIISKNLDGIITSWNEGAERIFGYTAQEAVGKHITLIIPPERRHEEAEIIARLRRGERIEHFETVRVRKDGTLLNISLTISPVRDASGRVSGASKVARDVTERKRAEERERQIIAEAIAANAKFRAVFEQTPVFAGIMTTDGVIIDANKLCLEACGYRANEVLGKKFWETGWWRSFPESQDKVRTATRLASEGTPFREVLHYSWADGSERLVDFAIDPIVDDHGKILFLHPTGVDITDIKRAEERYRDLAESLEAEVHSRTLELENRNLEVTKQSELLREFSQRLLQTQDEERRHIGRELHDSAGQTLTVLSISLAQLIEKAERTAPDVAADAENIQEIVQQLHREIRTTSYLLHPPLLDETGLASALSWYVQGLTERTDLDISLDISENVGRLPRAMELVVFRLVQECLTNIHRHSGSKTASIRIAREPDQIIVDVRDDGRGMSVEKLAEIQSGGSGVGIRGMRERLRPFDGKLNVYSRDSGTQILVTIPFSAESAGDTDQTEPLSAAV